MKATKTIILNMISMHCEHFVAVPLSHKKSLASELVDIWEKFVEWIGLECGFHELAFREIDNDWVYMNKAYSTDDLFSYFIEKIYKQE